MTTNTNDIRRKQLIKDFLKLHSPTPISESSFHALDKPLTKEEADIALKQMKTGKSPGPDGLTAGYYKTYSDILTPIFISAFDVCASPIEPPRDLLTAHIAVIPKPGKDLSLVSNYRPISLLNVDLKWYAKILANRILPLLPDLIHLDQVGFIPGREARDNTLKALNIHHWLTSTDRQGFLLSLDAEKAFDRVAWDYMTETLNCMGFPPRLINYILTLYSTPSARVRVNGHLSDAFSVSNGTRQGCPLSPLIFVLTLEPLLRCLRANPDIKGVEVNQRTYKVAAYADDILLFLTNPLTTIPNLLKDLDHFKLLSNLQINFSKSNALNISLPQELCTQCQHNFPFHWNSKALTYLGIQIPVSLSDLYSTNHLPLLQKVILDLKKWSVGLFSWFGRAAIIKMNILPKLLYLLQTVPVKLPPSFFSAYRKACTDFIWGPLRPRISYSRLTAPKLKGGVGLPDLKKYQQACHLTRIIDWNVHSDTKDWVQLESSMAPVPLAHSPWMAQHLIPLTVRSNPLIQPTLTSFRDVCTKHKISSILGPMTPLRLNPAFTPGMSRNFLGDVWPHSHVRAAHFFEGDQFISYNNLAAKMLTGTFPFWSYVQVRHFFQAPKPTPDWARQHTPFETLCLKTEPQRHLISCTYALLFSDHISEDNWTCRRWEEDLSTDLTESDWETIYNHIHKGTLNTYAQENAFKIASRWYRTPLKLHHMYPTLSPLCWRCGLETGSLLHIWWTCPKIQPFWLDVHRYIKQITTYNLEFTPVQFLLHLPSIPKKVYFRSLPMHMVNAAKMCIPTKWRSPNPPSMAEWFQRIGKIAEMEDLIHQARDTPSKFTHIWSCWIHFTNTVDYKRIITR